ncbi:MAG: hypothetical protein HZB38_18295, partial [Planctomycetes bacterium]|nr:hypothetical protein [Planctomycetota bacterium]
LAQWRTRRPLPTTQKVAPFDRETVLAFFRRLEKAETPEQIQFRFVLALLLWRKKALKLADTITEADREIWRFTQAQTQDAHHVVRPDLDEEQMERLSRQLEQLLAGQSGELEAIVSPAGPEALE